MYERKLVVLPVIARKFRAEVLFGQLFRGGWFFECEEISSYQSIMPLVTLRDTLSDLQGIQERISTIEGTIEFSRKESRPLLLLWFFCLVFNPLIIVRLVLGNFSTRNLAIMVWLSIAGISVFGMYHGAVGVFLGCFLLLLYLSVISFIRYRNLRSELEILLDEEELMMKRILSCRDELAGSSFMVCLPHLHVIHQPHLESLAADEQSRWDLLVLRLSSENRQVVVHDLLTEFARPD
jgi:hypothetical protein